MLYERVLMIAGQANCRIRRTMKLKLRAVKVILIAAGYLLIALSGYSFHRHEDALFPGGGASPCSGCGRLCRFPGGADKLL